MGFIKKRVDFTNDLQINKRMKCEYYDSCEVLEIFRNNCRNYEECRTYKYYQKHKIREMNTLGIGAMNSEDIGRLEKEIKNGSTN